MARSLHSAVAIARRLRIWFGPERGPSAEPSARPKRINHLLQIIEVAPHHWEGSVPVEHHTGWLSWDDLEFSQAKYVHQDSRADAEELRAIQFVENGRERSAHPLQTRSGMQINVVSV